MKKVKNAYEGKYVKLHVKSGLKKKIEPKLSYYLPNYLSLTLQA